MSDRNSVSDKLSSSSVAGTTDDSLKNTESNPVSDKLISVSTGVANETSHVADFIASNPIVDVSLDGKHDVTTSVSTFVDDTLAEFFSRKIRVATYNWADGFHLNQVIPLQDYWKKVSVKNKLQNFDLISYTMNVEVVINATPFHYSKLFLNARPCAEMSSAHDPAFYSLNGLAFYQKISQLYHIKSDVSSNSVMRMELPFVYPHNYQRIEDIYNELVPDEQSPWQVRLDSIVPLSFANPTASADVTVGVYVWATDVELTIPTSVTQGKSKKGKNPRNKYVRKGEEWSTKFTGFADQARQAAGVKIDPKEIEAREGGGFISNTMSTASNVLGMMEKVPVIGSYAGIAKGVTSNLGKVAAIFGFSRPAEDIVAPNFRPRPVTALFATSVADNIEKLSIDPTQGVSIDPGIVGGTGLDELSFQFLKQKESLVTTVLWDPTRAVDDELLWANVTPLYANKDSGSDAWSLSTIGFLAIPFGQWSGSIKYRFEVVKSQYHNGRIRVSYEPNGAALDSDMNTAYSKIVDISETSDFEFSVPWSQHSAYKNVPDEMVTQYFIPPAGIKNYDVLTCNGIIYVSVVNELTSPDDTTPIFINVYVSAGDDFEVTIPDPHRLNRMSHYDPVVAMTSVLGSKAPIREVEPVVQGDEVTLDEAVISVNLFGETLSTDVLAEKKSVFNGESYASYRNLLKRYSRQDVVLMIVNTTTRIYNFEFMNIPQAHGEVGRTLNGTTAAPMSLLEFVMHGYGFYRGAFRTQMIAGSNHIGSWSANRKSIRDPVFSEFSTSIDPINSAQLQQSRFGLFTTENNSWGGTNSTQASSLPTLTYEMPFYDAHRFETATYTIDGDNNYGLLPRYSTGGVDITVELTGATASVFGVDRYVATGEDFSLYFYMGSSPLYKTT